MRTIQEAGVPDGRWISTHTACFIYLVFSPHGSQGIGRSGAYAFRSRCLTESLLVCFGAENLNGITK